jgi:hypothetical protein
MGSKYFLQQSRPTFLVREFDLGQDFAAKVASSTRRISSEFARISGGEFFINTR